MCEIRPDFTRMATALNHEEPDRVPLAEAAVDYEIMSQFLGKAVTDDDVASQVDFWHQAGYDYVPLTVGMMRPGGVTKDSQISTVMESVTREDERGGDDGESWNLLESPRIQTEADFESFPWEAAARLDLSKFQQVQSLLPDGMRIISMSGKIFTLTWMLMGFENFAVSLVSNPRLVQKVLERVARIQLDGLEEVASIANVSAAWAVDDLAFGTGPMIRPEAIRRYIFPWYEEFGSTCRERGLYFFFHSDGVLWNLMDDLISLGVDALHPIDPTCMDIEQVKAKVGHRLCIIGNISNEILMTGTPEDVSELTKVRLRELSPGGGYCLGSGNSVPAWAKIENYRAMIETDMTYGRYPIDIK